MQTPPDSSATLAFLRDLWPDGIPEGSGFVTSSPDREAFQTDSLEKAAYELTEHAKPYTYFGCAVYERLSKGRGKSDNATAIPGIWSDIDTRDGSHKTDAKILPTRSEALDFLATLPLQPTVLLDSGGGYYAWWLFHEPLLMTTAAERKNAEQLVKHWQGFLQEQAQVRGFAIDGTAPLSWILRAEGTLNHKYSPPKVVRRVPNKDGFSGRYNPSDFEEWQGAYRGGSAATRTDRSSKPVAPLQLPGVNASGDADPYTWARAEDALRHISPDERDTWMRVGMALKSLFGDAAFTLWDQWSSLCKRTDSTGEPSYQPDTQRSQWDSFQAAQPGQPGQSDNGAITPGTLWWTALDNGWSGVPPGAGSITVGRRKATEAAGTDESPVQHAILIPGLHVLPNGDTVEVSPASFAREVFRHLPHDVFYRRGGIPGEIIGNEFRQLSVRRARLAASEHIRFALGKTVKNEDGDRVPVIVFQALSQDHASLIDAAAISDPNVRDIDLITSYPVCLPDWSISPPGFSQGVYYVGDAAPEPITDHATIHEVLTDLVVDFPFASTADRENFFGMLLTPLIRYACGGPAPLHIVTSSMERTGKSKLAATVFGGIITGKDTPVFQLGRSEEERDKRIFSILLVGETILLLDNENDKVDSQALASLLTSNVYRGRQLGQSLAPALPNMLTMVMTANTPQTSSEISKRMVPIDLRPALNPEMRSDFQHPDLTAYVAQQRTRVLACLLGMVRNWVAAGSPPGPPRPLGGYEGWSVVGGILGVHGFTAWMSNAAGWRGSADEFSVEVDELVAAWQAKGGAPRTPAELFELAKEVGLFEDQTGQSDPAKGTLAFAHKVLARLRDRPVLGFRVRKGRTKGRARYSLEPDTGPGGADAGADAGPDGPDAPEEAA